MVASPKGCGVREHDISCLCDVIVKEPTEFKLGLSDLEHYDYIAEKVGFCRPFTPDSVVDFMEKYIGAFDEIARIKKLEMLTTYGYIQPVTEKHPFHRVNNKNTKLTDEQFEWLKEQIVSGGSPTSTARMMLNIHGVQINKSYVSKLRMRMKESGEYDYRINQR